MSAAENKETVRRQFELLNGGDVAGAAGLWAPQSLNHGRPADRAKMAKVYESLRSLQEKHTLHEIIAEGEWVAVRTTCEGVHSTAPAIPVNSAIFSGRKPTGRSYTVQHIHLFRVDDGQLTEHWASRDDLATAKATGLELTPSPGGAGSTSS